MAATAAAAKQLHQLADYLETMRLLTNFDVASSVLFVYDYFLTLGMEINFIWFSPWTLTKAIYLVQRYLPFIDTVWLCLHHQLGSGLDQSICFDMYAASTWFFCIGICASELILTMRCWAVWHRSRTLSIFLPTFFALAFIPDVYITNKVLKSLTFGKLPYPEFVGCFVTGSNNLQLWVWVILMIYEGGIVTLMLIPGFRAYQRGGDSALVTIVYRDGVLYYIAIFVLSILNIIVIQKLSASYANLLSSLLRVIHSMLTSRVILHIRAHGNSTSPENEIVLQNRVNVTISKSVTFEP